MIDSKASQAYKQGIECEPTRGHFKVGSRAGEPDGYGVKTENGVLKLVKFVPATNDGCPMGTKEIVIAERKV